MFGGQIRFVCIEPYPRQFLVDGVPGISDLVREKVEDVPLEFFDDLSAGDVLFIDSSHVSKAGSDVNYLFFEVLPRLAPGVVVHIHDIFLPDEYPKVWVIDQGRNWNEQYLVRAFLQFNSAWEVLWAAHFMGTRHTAAVQRVFPRYPSLGGGGSLWIRRTVAPRTARSIADLPASASARRNRGPCPSALVRAWPSSWPPTMARPSSSTSSTRSPVQPTWAGISGRPTTVLRIAPSRFCPPGRPALGPTG
jgi:hypothetical protein